jgi:hypothetical protein
VNLPELIPLRGDFSPEDDAFNLTKPQSYALHPKVGFVVRDLYDQWQVCLSVFVVLDDKRERQNIARAYGTGVGARRGH